MNQKIAVILAKATGVAGLALVSVCVSMKSGIADGLGAFGIGLIIIAIFEVLRTIA